MRAIDNAAAMSMGGATVAFPGLSAGIVNEALPAFGAKRGVLLGSALPFGISGWQAAHVQGFTRLGVNDGLALGVDHSGIEGYREQQFRLVYGRRLGEKIYLGGGAHLLRVSADEYGSANGATFSLGVLVRALPELWLGARLQNPFQQKVGAYAATGSLRIGAAWQPSNIFMLLAEVEKSPDRPAQVKAGVEYRPVEVLAVRTGVRTGGTARFGFGAGVRLKNGLSLDAGSEWHPSLGMTPSAMVGWRI